MDRVLQQQRTAGLDQRHLAEEVGECVPPARDLFRRAAVEEDAPVEMMLEPAGEEQAVVIGDGGHQGQRQFVFLRAVRRHRDVVDQPVARQMAFQNGADRPGDPEEVPRQPGGERRHPAEGGRAAEHVVEMGRAAPPVPDDEDRRRHRRSRRQPARHPRLLQRHEGPAVCRTEPGCPHRRPAPLGDGTVGGQGPAQRLRVGSDQGVKPGGRGAAGHGGPCQSSGLGQRVWTGKNRWRHPLVAPYGLGKDRQGSTAAGQGRIEAEVEPCTIRDPL